MVQQDFGSLGCSDALQGNGRMSGRISVLIVQRFRKGGNGFFTFRPKSGEGVGSIVSDLAVTIFECPAECRNGDFRIDGDRSKGFGNVVPDPFRFVV